MGEEKMKRNWTFTLFIYALCFSFLWMVTTCPLMAAEKQNLPIGELLFKGDLKVETSKNTWNKAVGGSLPVFLGTNLKTEKGTASIYLNDGSRIGINGNSLFYLDQEATFILSQGNIDFYIPATSELKIQAGNVLISRGSSLQAGKDLVLASKESQEIMGTAFIHPNGNVMVKSFQGRLSLMNRQHVVLADLSPRDSVTIPAKADGTAQVAQTSPNVAAEGTGAGASTEGFLGLSSMTWVGIGAAAVVTGVGVGIAVSGGGGSSSSPACP
jgi:hypothetical protein